MSIYYSSEWYHRRAELIGRPGKIPLPPIARAKSIRGGNQLHRAKKAAVVANLIENIIKQKRSSNVAAHQTTGLAQPTQGRGAIYGQSIRGKAQRQKER